MATAVKIGTNCPPCCVPTRRNYCDGNVICPEGASDVTVDLSAVTDNAGFTPCAVVAVAHFGPVVSVPGGFGSPFNGLVAGHQGIWQFDQTATVGFVTARLLVSFVIACSTVDGVARLGVLGELQIICADADGIGEYGPIYLNPAVPFDCHRAFILNRNPVGTVSGGITWPAFLKFQLP